MPQVGVFFAKGMCSDTSLEGNVGDPQVASPIECEGQRAWPCGMGSGVCSILRVDIEDILQGEVVRRILLLRPRVNKGQ